MASLIEFLFQVVLGSIFFAFRALIYWLLGSRGLPLRQAWKLGEAEQRVWHRGKHENRISGRELLIRLVAGLLTAGLLLGVGYQCFRLAV